MPPVPAAKAATPQTIPAAKSPALNGAANSRTPPSARAPQPTGKTLAAAPASQRVGGGASPAGTAARAPPVGAAKGTLATAPAHPGVAAGSRNGALTPSSMPAATNPHTTSPSIGGVGAVNGAGPNFTYGSDVPYPSYGGPYMQMSGAAGPNAGAGGIAYPDGTYGNSMYGVQSSGFMYPGVGMSSMYGMQPMGANGMHTSGYGTSMMGSMGGGMGSMYGMGSMGGYGFGSSFGGSLYGGSMYGMTGSLYGAGGSLYGSNDHGAVMGSMYGSHNGSLYGGLTSFYSVDRPHTGLGTVRKHSVPGFSYSFGSNLGTVAYKRDSFRGTSPFSSRRESSFRGTSRILQAEERDVSKETEKTRGVRATERGKEAVESKRDDGRGATGNDKDGNISSDNKTTAKASTKGGESYKPEPVVKNQTSLEAPHSPPSTRGLKSGAPQAPVLSTDFRIRNVAVLEQDRTGSAKVTKKGDTCVLNGKSYTMDEVLEYAPAAGKSIPKSRHIHDMIEHVVSGHNTALLVSDDGKATAASKAAVVSTVAKLMDELNNPSRNSYAGVSASMCGLHPNSMMRDLFADKAPLKPMEVGNSPLFGPAIMNTTSVPIKSADDFNGFFEAALKRSEEETLMVCMLKVKQVRNGAADGRDNVFLSSFLLGISRRGLQQFHDIVDKVPSSSHDLFRYAVNGPSVCVHVVAVSQGLNNAQVLSDCAKMGGVQNTAPRSGNVRRFIDFTEEQLKHMRERCDNATGSEKHELKGHVRRLSLILEDARKLLADPKNTEAKLYRLENETADSADAVTEEEAKPRAAPENPVVKGTPPSPQGDKPRSTNVASVAIVDSSDARAYSVKDLTITAGGRPFTVDEVILRKDVKADAMGSKETDKVLTAFLKGYNGAVVELDSTTLPANRMGSPAMAVVFAAVRGALAKDDSKSVRVSIALVRDTGKAVDLTSTKGGAAGAAGDIVVSSSPLFGPVVHNAALHKVLSIEEMQRLVGRARENAAAAEWDEHCVVHVSIVHCFVENNDVLVSSLLVTFASTSCKAYSQVLQQCSSSHDFSDLYRYAFGGAATTALVVSLGKEDEVAHVINALSTQATANAVRNRSPRQGSIKNFIAYTTASLQKRRERLATLAEDSEERQAMEKVMAPMERMLEDHKMVMADPDSNFPRGYAAEGGAPKESTVSPTGLAAKAAPSQTTKATATPSSPAGNNGARSRPAPAGAASATTAQTAPAAKAADAVQCEDASASGFTEPRVVAFVNRDVAAEKTLSLGDKDYAVDEVVKRVKRGGSAAGSTAVAEIEARLLSVHNCALISASSVTDAPTKEEPVWGIFEQCLRKAMAAARPGEDIRSELTFAVVSADEMVDDLLSKEPLTARRPLEVVSSPIYGSRVNGGTTASVQSADELMHLMAKVHERAASQLDAVRRHGALMVGTAVLRRRTADGDVEVASLMGMLTGASVKALHEALTKEQVARRALLSCAYGGPSATITILNLGAEDKSAQDMVSTAVALSKKQRNLVNRSGSVRAFTNYTESAMKRELARAEAATGEAKERHLQKAERLRPVVEDHKKLLEDFNAPVPAYPGSRSALADRDKVTPSPATVGAPNAERADRTRSSPATSGAEAEAAQQQATPTPTSKVDAGDPNRIHSIIVVTPGSNPAGSVATIERLNETHIKTTIAGAERKCECDEVVKRLDTSSTVQADLLNTAVQHFLGGFNTSLLCCDLGGSNAGPLSCAHLVHHAAETKPANSELYFAINCVRDREARDMLQTGSVFAPMKVANSPIFGPMVHASAMPPLTETGVFDTAFSAACAAAAKDNAMVVVNLILKVIQEGNGRRDVVVSSLLVTLVTDPQAYAGVVNAPPKSDRKLFQYAVQGSCFTVGMLGLPSKIGEGGLAECLDIYEKLSRIENRPMRNGSVRRFLAYSLNATADVKQKLSEVTDERQRAMYEQRLAQLELMVADSRVLLESPKGQPLKVYQ
ncbi:hypothetical protein ABL78_2825 [Leptomonas seymouri]|uniref:Uncharacterized protein n=1 Tax=Leptomonas seymouri TaxID=5684 RepID=A0A0N1ILE0_LEPSE|nr:hypothetical protein ABL78_2825 [Leptomonas seymouri]|eukprot:KPI88095.1 hypothetical protein ABL78_2825 [Leptomonas seymouri]